MKLSSSYISTVFLFVASFADAEDIASKWNIDPVDVSTTDNDYSLLYGNIDDSLSVGSNVLVTMYDGDCKADGATTYGKAGKETESYTVFTSLAVIMSSETATITFTTILTEFAKNSKMYDDDAATMSFCCRFGLFADGNEINFQETVVTLTVALNDIGFTVSDVGVASKARESSDVTQEYKVVAGLCDGQQTTPFNQRSVIGVCVTPDTAASNAGIIVSSIDAFTWTQDTISQPAITSSNTVSTDLLTSITSTSSFESILFATFFAGNGAVGGTGSATLAFPTTPSGTNCHVVCAAESASGLAFPAKTSYTQFQSFVAKYISNDATVKSMYGNVINCWGISALASIRQAFYDQRTFNEPLDCWNTGSVTDMFQTFFQTYVFNQDLSNWDVSYTENMKEMFRTALMFDQDIGEWNIAKVTDFRQMFAYAPKFNQDIDAWNVANSRNLRLMFFQSTVFNQDLSSWDVAKVTDFRNMFA